MNYERFEKRKWEWQKSVEEIMGKKKLGDVEAV
jgi:hypothetical protein